MAKNMQMVIIDVEKLQAEIIKRGLDKHEISERMGVNKNYLTSAMNGNSWQDGIPKISKQISVALKALYDIDEDSYRYQEPVVEETPNRDVLDTNKLFVSQLTGEELSNLIYKAVFSAVKHAWEDTEN